MNKRIYVRNRCCKKKRIFVRHRFCNENPKTKIKPKAGWRGITKRNAKRSERPEPERVPQPILGVERVGNKMTQKRLIF